MNPKTIIKSLECNYTDEELSNFKNELVKKLTEVGELQNEKKDFDADKSAKIKSREDDISRLVNNINVGYEFRTIECDVKIDINKDEKYIIRTDTNEVVETLKLRPEEKQTELEIDETEYEKETKEEKAVGGRGTFVE